MTQEQLSSHIEHANWFHNLGQSVPAPGEIAIQSLRAWADDDSYYDRHHQKIAESMDWLPAQAQDPDPIHGDCLADHEQSLAVYKQALACLRTVSPHPLLKVGHHEFQHVAHGAAAYACRRAAVEIHHGRPGFWCRLVPLYAAGQWPCGLMPDQTLVVF